MLDGVPNVKPPAAVEGAPVPVVAAPKVNPPPVVPPVPPVDVCPKEKPGHRIVTERPVTVQYTGTTPLSHAKYPISIKWKTCRSN